MGMTVILALLAGADGLDQSRAPEPANGPAIVVTAQRIEDYRARLAACLARHCPVNEDADATLALAEALFLQGEYDEARYAVRGSLRRNHGQASAFPEPVSDLYRADARIARHLGLDGDTRASTRNILRALQRGIPREDHRHFTARLEISETLTAFGRYTEARDELARLAAVARAAGRDDVAATAELRTLWVDYIEAPHGPAMRRLTEMAARSGAEDRLRSRGATILLARIYRERGDTARSDSLLAGIRTSGGRRRLLYSPPYELAVHEIALPPGLQEMAGAGRTTTARLSDTFEDKWIDVGFWVQPDGSVASLDILRQGSNPDWARPLLQSIRQRRYSRSEDDQPTYRLERYTYTAGYETVTGSHMQQRSPRARVEYLDLSDGASAPGPPPAAPSR